MYLSTSSATPPARVAPSTTTPPRRVLIESRGTRFIEEDGLTGLFLEREREGEGVKEGVREREGERGSMKKAIYTQFY